MSAVIENHAEARNALRGKNSRVIFNNTRVVLLPDDSVAIRLHATNVVTYHPDTTDITLDAGGWVTRTTVDRINAYTPHSVNVRRSNGELLVTDATDEEIHWSGSHPITVRTIR